MLQSGADESLARISEKKTNSAQWHERFFTSHYFRSYWLTQLPNHAGAKKSRLKREVKPEPPFGAALFLFRLVSRRLACACFPCQE